MIDYFFIYLLEYHLEGIGCCAKLRCGAFLIFGCVTKIFDRGEIY